MEKKSIIDYLSDYAVKTPGRAAFIIHTQDKKKELSFGDLFVGVQRLASRLRDLHLAGERVILTYQDSGDFIVPFLACQYLGVTAVPLDPGKKVGDDRRLLNIIKNVAPRALFCPGHSRERINGYLEGVEVFGPIEIVVTDEFSEPAGATEAFEPVLNDIAFIQYTSGSVSAPKGVVVSNENLLQCQKMIRNTFHCDQESMIFSWLPFYHDMGLVGNLLHALYTGCTCILLPPVEFIQRPRKWLEYISKYRVTHSGGPNFAYDLCINRVAAGELEHLDLSSWRVAYNGAEMPRYATMERFAEYFAPAGFQRHSFYPCYGLAEATLLVSGGKKEGGDLTLLRSVVGSGLVAEGIEVGIALEGGGLSPKDGVEGEICISGKSVMSGYWNIDTDERTFFADGKKFLRTGDIGCLSGGELFVAGRIKEMLKINGKNVFPYDIEQWIGSKVQTIENNRVAIFCGGEFNEQVVIAAEIRKEHMKSESPGAVIDEIDNIVKGQFGVNSYDIVLMRPRRLPATTSGKLQRMKCRELYFQGALDMLGSKLQRSERTAPTFHRDPANIIRGNAGYGDIKRYILDLVRISNPNIDPAGINDYTELTSLGLDSLTAVGLINRINHELNINITAETILNDNGLYHLIQAIDTLLWLKNKPLPGGQLII